MLFSCYASCIQKLRLDSGKSLGWRKLKKGALFWVTHCRGLLAFFEDSAASGGDVDALHVHAEFFLVVGGVEGVLLGDESVVDEFYEAHVKGLHVFGFPGDHGAGYLFEVVFADEGFYTGVAEHNLDGGNASDAAFCGDEALRDGGGFAGASG